MPYHGVRGDFLLGLVREDELYALEEQSIGNCVFCALTLPKGGGWIALKRGLRGLQKRRVRRCVFAEGFPQKPYFLSRGIREVDVQPLLRKKAGQWALAERQARGLQGSIAVHTERLTEDVEKAVVALLEKTDCLLFPSIRGGEELQRQIRRDSGAVLRLCSPQRLSEAETLLDFSGSPWEGQALTLRIGETKPPCFLLPAEWAEKGNVYGSQLAAALWELGEIPADRIGLKCRI